MRRDGLTRKKALWGATLAIACAVVVPALAQDRDVFLVTGGSGLSEIDGFSISRSGETVAFSSFERLLPADTDDVRDVYLRRGAGLILASQGDFRDQTPRSTSGAPTVSQDGSRVFFVTAEKLDFADDDAVEDVYMWTGDVAQLVSGPAANRPQSDQPATLAPGLPAPTAERAIITTSAPLVTADTDQNAVDLYEVGSTGPKLLTPGTASPVGAMSANAALTHVTFETVEPLVDATDKDTTTDTYLTVGGSYTHLTRASDPAASAGPGFADLVSDDGSKVLIMTVQALDPRDADGALDAYLVPVQGGAIWLSGPGTCPAEPCRADSYAATADLSRIAFTTTDVLTPADTDAAADVYLWAGGQLELVSAGPLGGNGAADVVVIKGGRATRLSADGRGVLFATAEKLVVEDADTTLDLYERREGTTRLVSRGEFDSSVPIEPAESGAYRDGDRVVFSTAGALTRGDSDGRLDVFARDGAAVSLVSTGSNAFDADLLGASADAGRIFFRTREALTPDDTDEARDVFEARRRPAVTPPPVGDTTPPELGLRLTRTKFRASTKAARIASAAARRKKRRRTPVGTTIELTLGEAALVNVELERLDRGRVSKGRCVKATRRLRRAKTCTLTVRPKGRLSVQRPAGVTKVTFYGRLPGGAKPRAARYRLNARAYDAAGNASALRVAPFTVVSR